MFFFLNLSDLTLAVENYLTPGNKRDFLRINNIAHSNAVFNVFLTKRKLFTDSSWLRGKDSGLSSVGSLVRFFTGYPLVGWPGRYMNVRRDGGLFLVPLQLKDLFELIVKIISIDIPAHTVVPVIQCNVTLESIHQVPDV